ncbi:MAG: DUF5040 domain-containing protein [Alistipes sp.]|nr:DUF5040 domain-containing protein [Alistipes sp.]
MVRLLTLICVALLSVQCSSEASSDIPKAEALCIVGASFAYPENCWFEMACERLGYKPINKAISGENISGLVQRIKEHKLMTIKELDSFATLVVMYTHDVDVYSATGANAQYAAAFDYLIKSYTIACQSLEYNRHSRYYGIEGGKPVDILVCTHWHDARKRFNSSVRALDAKWECVRLCEFDKHIGFTAQDYDPATGKHLSVLYAHPDQNATEVIDGITYGWHPKRGRDSEIQQRMADIFCKCF